MGKIFYSVSRSSRSASYRENILFLSAFEIFSYGENILFPNMLSPRYFRSCDVISRSFGKYFYSHISSKCRLKCAINSKKSAENFQYWRSSPRSNINVDGVVESRGEPWRAVESRAESCKVVESCGKSCKVVHICEELIKDVQSGVMWCRDVHKKALIVSLF